jgi:hypothetical protein
MIDGWVVKPKEEDHETLSHGICLFLAQCLLIVGLSNPLSGAATISLRIPGTALRPRDSTVTFSGTGGTGMYATSNPGMEWNAPLYLPQGAVIVKVRMFYIDNNQTYNCNGYFIVSGFTGTPVVYSNSSSGSSSSVAYVDIQVGNHTVDYSNYVYMLVWVPFVADPSMVLVGFEIFYTPPPGRAAVIPLF